MKKLMIIAMGAALALTACVNNEMVEDAAPKEVSFKGFNLGESTRATFAGTEFMVYAQFSNIGDGSDYINFWGDAAKEITKQDGVWKVNETTKYYWPKAGAVSFWGYYPKGQDGVSFDKATGVKVTGVSAAEAAVLMLADPAQSELKTANSVPMVFKHAGAQVIFRFANASATSGFNLTITDVAISNVSAEADYKWGVWSNWSNVATTLSDGADHAIANTAIGTDTDDDLYTFNVIPQAVDVIADKKITSGYSVEDTNAGYSYKGTATLDATDWNENTKHYYNVTFNFTAGEEIKFTPSTTDWVSEDKDYTVAG
jgi:hypothetical protein